jgi:uncharacterized protein (TIGR02301 family)
MKSTPLPIALIAAFAVSGGAWAQAGPGQDQPPQPNEQQPSAEDAGYRQQLAQLAEVLGGSHYLETLCHGQGDQRWRDYMRSVINRAPDYSDELVEAFNRGYAEQQDRFNDCDADAQQAQTELRAQGMRISQGLAARHAE